MGVEPVSGTPWWLSYRFGTGLVVDFYRNLLEWEMVEDGDFGACGPGFSCYLDGKNVAYLSPIVEPGYGGDPEWYVNFYCDNLDRSIVGVSVAGGIITSIGGSEAEERSATFRDPMHGSFGCIQTAKFGDFSTFGRRHGLCWIDLRTPEVDKIVKFYSDALDWSAQPTLLIGRNPERYNMAAKGRYGEVEEFASISGASSYAHWRPYFSVGSLPKAVTKASKLGGRVHWMADRFADLTDPGGVPFGVAEF
ncbi:hypothetical protein [Streptomyces sp. NPDC005533]|uniref:hypothetical protein n=1 Tax=Streptomyces sp. NPDC005533 TaxID=3364723 RepID=UPI00368C5D8A